MSERLQIINETKGKLPDLPFKKIKNAILNQDFEISLVFIDNQLSQKLNKKHKGKKGPANVLTFPLSKKEAEIFIDIEEAKKEHDNFDMKLVPYIGYLFIHSLLHLKGYSHGSTMEKRELYYLKKFNLV